jgi:hypothetical protein
MHDEIVNGLDGAPFPTQVQSDDGSTKPPRPGGFAREEKMRPHQ